LRYGEPERLGGLEVDHQVELGRLLDRQIGGFCTLQDSSGVNPLQAIGARKARAIAEQAASDGEVRGRAIAGTACRNASPTIWGRKPMGPRTSPSACTWTRVAKAASISLSVRAFKTWRSIRVARTVSCICPMMRSADGSSGCTIRAINLARGTSSNSSSIEEWREVRPLAQLGDAQLERAEARVEAALAIPVAVIEAVAGAFVPAGADQALDIGFHQNLQHRLRYGSQEIAVAALLQQLNQRHSVVGHRVLGGLGVKCLHLHLSRPSR
jgi:hypothetical protein